MRTFPSSSVTPASCVFGSVNAYNPVSPRAVTRGLHEANTTQAIIKIMAKASFFIIIGIKLVKKIEYRGGV